MAVGDLVVNLVTRTDRFSKGLNSARGALERFSSFARSSFTAFSNVAATAGAAMAGLGVYAVKLAADAEQTAISFEVLTGSIATGQSLIESLRRMGAATPFEFGDLAGAGRTLLAFGRSAGDVQSDLDLLSNVAAGDANKLNSLALVFGQISANARLTGGDLLQLVNAGFNPLQQIAERTGETMTELRDRMSRGKISFDEVRQAFVDATSAGGRFEGMNERMSKTLSGRWSTLKDEITSAMIEVGQAIMENMDLNAVTKSLGDMAANFKAEFIPAIKEFLKAAPNMVDALSKIGAGMAKIAEHAARGATNIQKWAFLTTSIASGMTPQEAAQAYMQEFNPELMKKAGGGIQGGVAIEPIRGPGLQDALKKAFPKSIANLEEKNAAADKSQQAFAEREAGKVLAGVVRQGLAGLESGLMSLGGPKAKQEDFTSKVGRLEANSQETFDVMRANVGREKKDDVPAKQLKVAEKQEKLLDKIAKAVSDKPPKGYVKVLGLD